MSENSPDNVSSRLEKHKREKEKIEASFKQAINESVTNASIDWGNALQNVVAQIESLSKGLVENLQNLSSEQIKQAQSQINLLIQHLNLLSQSVAQQSQAISNQIESTKTTVISDLQALGQTVSHESDNVINQSKTALQTIPEQMKILSQQIITDTKQAINEHQYQLKQIQQTGRIAVMFIAIAILFAIGLFAYNYYLVSQVSTAQRRFDTLQQYISQTPIQSQALSMIDIYQNNGKEGGILITPKNQQTAFWGKNQSNEKTLLVTSPPINQQSITRPNKK